MADHYGFDPHGFRDGQSSSESDAPFDSPLHYPHEKNPPASVNDFHRYSDVDTSTLSQHHTLGPSHNQSAPGDHSHDGGSSKNIGAFTDWLNSGNPIWVGGGTTQPSIGNGFFYFRYAKIGSLVFCHIAIIGGTTTNWGNGDFQFILPFTAKTTPQNIATSLTGAVYGFSNVSNLNYAGALWARSSGNRVSIVNDANGNAWSSTSPVTWGNTGQQLISASFFYEAA